MARAPLIEQGGMGTRLNAEPVGSLHRLRSRTARPGNGDFMVHFRRNLHLAKECREQRKVANAGQRNQRRSVADDGHSARALAAS
jgi:hypothetical protein